MDYVVDHLGAMCRALTSVNRTRLPVHASSSLNNDRVSVRPGDRECELDTIRRLNFRTLAKGNGAHQHERSPRLKWPPRARARSPAGAPPNGRQPSLLLYSRCCYGRRLG